jgi:Zn-dependent protease
VSCSFAAVRPTSATRQPVTESPIAVARPIPLPAPVTIAVEVSLIGSILFDLGFVNTIPDPAAYTHGMFTKTMAGSFRIFRLFGISVYLHWMWFLVLAWVVTSHNDYNLRVFNLVEFIALFAIVLMHEFGHALACRSVGGRAEHIVLWPLGGVAFVQPPQRPGAMLWSIAAGPLVNVLLAPLLFVFVLQTGASFSLNPGQGDIQTLATVMFWINIAIFIFNMLPVYPLDGGQILQSLLWFVVGRARSLQVATLIGLVASVGMAMIALKFEAFMLFIIALFIAWQSYNGYRASRFLVQQEQQFGP